MADDDEILGEVIACARENSCFSDGVTVEDQERQMSTCPWCRHIIIHADGTETVREPIEA